MFASSFLFSGDSGLPWDWLVLGDLRREGNSSSLSLSLSSFSVPLVVNEAVAVAEIVVDVYGFSLLGFFWFCNNRKARINAMLVNILSMKRMHE